MSLIIEYRPQNTNKSESNFIPHLDNISPMIQTFNACLSKLCECNSLFFQHEYIKLSLKNNIIENKFPQNIIYKKNNTYLTTSVFINVDCHFGVWYKHINIVLNAAMKSHDLDTWAIPP